MKMDLGARDLNLNWAVNVQRPLFVHVLVLPWRFCDIFARVALYLFDFNFARHS